MRLALYASHAGDHEQRLMHRRAAEEVEPNNPLVIAFAVGDAAQNGNNEKAVALQARAVELDPLSAIYRYNLAWHLYVAGRHDESLAQLKRVQELNPDHSRGLECLNLVMLRRFEEAERLTRDQPAGSERHQCRALTLHSLGDRAGSDAALGALVASGRKRDLIRIAEVHAFRGEAGAAFRWLAATSEKCGRSTGPLPECMLKVDRYSPLLASLHRDPRWKPWSATFD